MTLFYSGYSPASLPALSQFFPLLTSPYIPNLQIFDLSLVLLLIPTMEALVHIFGLTPINLYIIGSKICISIISGVPTKRLSSNHSPLLS